MQGAEILTKFTADTKDVDQATKKFDTSIGGLTKAFTLGNLAAKGISKTIEVFNYRLDDAIKRTDTLNNFPKVMSNLGIGAEEAEASINELSKKLNGLPTKLDDAAGAVQRFTSGNGDIEKSTKMFLAVNNAILAGGASSDIQASALEQLSQAYSKGKPDMMEWRTMLMAMPAQMKQVANAMGLVDATELGDKLRDGTISMDQFMDTIIKMNTTGVNGFQSFEEQAKNATGGIQTSITNMKTSVTRGVANVIQSLDEALEPMGGISGVLTKIGSIGEKVFTTIGQAIEKVMPVIMNIASWIIKNKDLIEAIIIPVLAFVAAFKTISVITGIIQGISAAMTVLNAVLMANPIGLIVAAIVAVIAAIVLLYKKCTWFRNAVNKVINFIKKIIDGLKPIIQKVFEFVKQWFDRTVAFWTPIFKALEVIIKKYIEIVKNVLTTIFNAIKTYISFTYNVFKTVSTWLWNNVLQPIINYVKWCWETAHNIISTGIEIIKIIFTALKEHIWDNTLKPIYENVKDIFNKIKDFISGIVDKVRDKFYDLRDKIKNAFQVVRDTIVNIFSGIVETLKKPINSLIDSLNGVIDKINSIELAGKHTNIDHIPKLATGTNYVPDDMLAMIHEGEAVVPKKFNPYANGINASTIGTMGTQNNIIINIDNNMKFDALGQLVNRVKTYSGGAKNDFNYGMGR